MRVEQAQLEVARDAWLEEPHGVRWKTLLPDVPEPVRRYIAKRFEREREELAKAAAKLEAAGKEVPPGFQSLFRITALSYAPEGDGRWAVTDNTPGE